MTRFYPQFSTPDARTRHQRLTLWQAQPSVFAQCVIGHGNGTLNDQHFDAAQVFHNQRHPSIKMAIGHDFSRVFMECRRCDAINRRGQFVDHELMELVADVGIELPEFDKYRAAGR